MISGWAHSAQDWIDLLESLVNLGLATGDADLTYVWSHMCNEPNSPPLPVKLEQIAQRLQAGTWEPVLLLMQRALRIVRRRFERWATSSATVIEQRDGYHPEKAPAEGRWCTRWCS